MKSFIFTIIISLLLISSALIAEQMFRVHVGPEYSGHTSISELQHRIWVLEKAVSQLQSAKQYSCYLKSDIKGTYFGTGESLIAAKGKALKACSDATKNSIFCDESNLRCDE
jgi:hypothetical protein